MKEFDNSQMEKGEEIFLKVKNKCQHGEMPKIL